MLRLSPRPYVVTRQAVGFDVDDIVEWHAHIQDIMGPVMRAAEVSLLELQESNSRDALIIRAFANECDPSS